MQRLNQSERKLSAFYIDYELEAVKKEVSERKREARLCVQKDWTIKQALAFEAKLTQDLEKTTLIQDAICYQHRSGSLFFKEYTRRNRALEADLERTKKDIMEWRRDKESRARESRFKYFDLLIGVFVTPVAAYSFCKTIVNEATHIPLYVQFGVAMAGALYVTRQYHWNKIKEKMKERKEQNAHKDAVHNKTLNL